MNFETYLTEEALKTRDLDNKLKIFNDIIAKFYNRDLVQFVSTLSKQTGLDLDEQHKALHESLLDFVYELDSAGANLSDKS